MSGYPLINVVDQNGTILGATAANPIATRPPAPATVYSEVSAVARTTNGNTAPAAFPTGINQCIVAVNVTGFAGGTNVIVSLQQQDANGNWVTIGASATITATGTYAFSVGQAMTNANMLVAGGQYRLAWTVTGTFTTLTTQLSVQAR